jgi:hypothetical protein
MSCGGAVHSAAPEPILRRGTRRDETEVKCITQHKSRQSNNPRERVKPQNP